MDLQKQGESVASGATSAAGATNIMKMAFTQGYHQSRYAKELGLERLALPHTIPVGTSVAKVDSDYTYGLLYVVGPVCRKWVRIIRNLSFWTYYSERDVNVMKGCFFPDWTMGVYGDLLLATVASESTEEPLMTLESIVNNGSVIGANVNGTPMLIDEDNRLVKFKE